MGLTWLNGFSNGAATSCATISAALLAQPDTVLISVSVSRNRTGWRRGVGVGRGGDGGVGGGGDGGGGGGADRRTNQWLRD